MHLNPLVIAALDSPRVGLKHSRGRSDPTAVGPTSCELLDLTLREWETGDRGATRPLRAMIRKFGDPRYSSLSWGAHNVPIAAGLRGLPEEPEPAWCRPGRPPAGDHRGRGQPGGNVRCAGQRRSAGRAWAPLGPRTRTPPHGVQVFAEVAIAALTSLVIGVTRWRRIGQLPAWKGQSVDLRDVKHGIDTRAAVTSLTHCRPQELGLHG